MSDFYKYTLSPGAVASMTEPTPDLQRNYRQRDMLDGYGELQENGRWKYNLHDLVSIWICDRISNHGENMDRRDGFRLGKQIASRVINAFLMKRHSWDDAIKMNPLRGRFIAYLYRGADANGVGGSEVKVINELSDLTRITFEHAQIVDAEELAESLPESIRGLLIVADENAADDATPDFDEWLADAPELGVDD